MGDTSANLQAGNGRTQHLDWGNEAAFVTSVITTALENGVNVSADFARNFGITTGKIVLKGSGLIGDVASTIFQFQEASIDDVTRYDTVKIMGGTAAGVVATGALVAAGASTLPIVIVGAGVGLAYDQTFGRLIDAIEQLAALRDDDGGMNGRNMVPRSYGSAVVPRDTSGYGPANADAGEGIMRGNEYNTLDLISHQNFLLGRYSNPPTANQTLARDVRDAMGNDGDPNTYPDAIIRVAAAPKSHSNSSSNDNHTTVHSTKGYGY